MRNECNSECGMDDYSDRCKEYYWIFNNDILFLLVTFMGHIKCKNATYPFNIHQRTYFSKMENSIIIKFYVWNPQIILTRVMEI